MRKASFQPKVPLHRPSLCFDRHFEEQGVVEYVDASRDESKARGSANVHGRVDVPYLLTPPFATANVPKRIPSGLQTLTPSPTLDVVSIYTLADIPLDNYSPPLYTLPCDMSAFF